MRFKNILNNLTLIIAVLSLIVSIRSCIISEDANNNTVLMHKEVLIDSNRPYLFYNGNYCIDFHGFNSNGEKYLENKYLKDIKGKCNLLFSWVTDNREKYNSEYGYNYWHVDDKTGVCSFYIPLKNIGNGIAKNIAIYEIPNYKLNYKNFNGRIMIHNSNLNLEESAIYSLALNKNEEFVIEMQLEFYILNDRDTANYLFVYQDLYGNTYSSVLQFEIRDYNNTATTAFYYINSDSVEFDRVKLNSLMNENINYILNNLN